MIWGKMTRRRLQPVIDAVVPPLLAAGFEKRQWSLAAFSKKKHSVDDPIVASDGPAYTWRLNEDVLGVFIARTGTTWLGPIYGVRHEGIMRLLEEAGINLDGDDALFKPTLTCYKQLLDRQPGGFLPNIKSEWTFRSKEDVNRYVPRVQAAIKRIVLPYMRRCRTLGGIVGEMRKNEKDPRAYAPIAAGLHLLSRNEEAIDFLARWPTVHSRLCTMMCLRKK